jgi:hypothetical protein
MEGAPLMSVTTILDNEFATLVYHPEEKIVHHTFHKPIGGDAFRTVLKSGVALLREHGAHKWLSDDRENSALSDEDTQWSINEWFPSAKEAGWKYWALVMPPDVIARINLSEFVFNYSQQGVRVSVFNSPDKAMTWLERV